MSLLGIDANVLLGQLLLGLINGGFYALLSLGVALIFGMLHIVNFAHGALFMMGAFVAWMLLEWGGVNYWWALVLVPIIVGAFGLAVERTLIRKLYRVDPIYGFLLTLGIALIIEGGFRQAFGSVGIPYRIPSELRMGLDLGFIYLPAYRVWVLLMAVIGCAATWWLVERTSLGAKLRAATENGDLVAALGINVRRLVALTYGAGVALAGFTGVLAAPIYSVNPNMGSSLMVVIFAIVIIGGMGSILGSIVAGFSLGLIEALTKMVYPQGSASVIFVAMVFVLLVRPAGLFGKSTASTGTVSHASMPVFRADLENSLAWGVPRIQLFLFAALVLLLLIAPVFLYPVLVMRFMCLALFACAFNLMLGYGGLMSFGHAAFFGMGGYLAAWFAKMHGFTPEVSILLGGAIGAIMGVAFGAIAIRRQGLYFAMITLALAEMVYFFCLQAPFTGGENGLQNVPRGHVLGLWSIESDIAAYWFVLIVFAVCFLIILRTIHSPFGAILTGIRDNETRAGSLGYHVNAYKLMAFALSAGLAAIAGGTKSIVFGIASLTDVHFAMSGEVVLMTLMGGLGTVFGPVVGAFALVFIEYFLAQAGSLFSITQGIIFVVCVLMFRAGIVGVIARKWRLPI